MKRTLAALSLGALLFLGGAVRVEPCGEYHEIYLPLMAWTVIPAQGAGSTYGIEFPGSTWCYDWSREPDCGRNPVPMLWDETQVGLPIGPGEWLMGFNEPEMEGQANIAPALGAELWQQVESAYPDRRLVSPSASVPWLTEWWTTYVNLYGETPRVDAVGHHCYGAYDAQFAVTKCTAAADAIVAWASDRGVPEVWVTEFAHLPCWPEGDAGTIEFMQAMVEHYYTNPTITRWAWFQTSYRGDEPWAFGPACNTSLVDFDTWELTAFGIEYAKLPYGW